MAQIYRCCQCGESYDLSKMFNKSYSALYTATERLPICRNCLNSLYHLYKAQYHSPKLAMKRICMAFDLYYSDSILEKCDTDNEAIVGNYIRQLNMKQHKGKTFDNTLQEGFVFDDDDLPLTERVVEEPDDGIDPKDIEKWGDGFKAEDYKTLNDHYRLLKASNPQANADNQEIFIMDLCYIKMQQVKAVRENKPSDYGTLAKQYRDTFSLAGLRTVKETDDHNNDCWGEWMYRIEHFTPAEYYKNKKLFRDADGIGDYIKRFVQRPLKNLMCGTNERDKEYYVKDDEEEDDDTSSDSDAE